MKIIEFSSYVIGSIVFADGFKCPKCGEWIDYDEEVCQTCGYTGGGDY